jgi:uncharacterized Zn finger protein
MQALRKKGADIQPVEIEGRKIARTFWGEAWCDHLESFSDYANRLPRGRTYVRNGSVCHLEIKEGRVLAKVSGSELYDVDIRIETLPPKKWTAIKKRCAGQVGSLLELLKGQLSNHVMQVVTDRKEGLFPLPREIKLDCDCPDWAVMCKHVAAVLYGVGARLDQRPELLFQLRGVDHEDLISADAEAAVSAATSRGTSKRLADDSLADVFGIDLDTSEDTTDSDSSKNKRPKKKGTTSRGKKVASKKVAKKKAVRKKATKKAAKKKKAVVTAAVKKKAGDKAALAKAKGKKKTAKKKTAKKKTAKKKAVKKKAAKKKATEKKAATKSKRGKRKTATKKSGQAT